MPCPVKYSFSKIAADFNFTSYTKLCMCNFNYSFSTSYFIDIYEFICLWQKSVQILVSFCDKVLFWLLHATGLTYYIYRCWILTCVAMTTSSSMTRTMTFLRAWGQTQGQGSSCLQGIGFTSDWTSPRINNVLGLSFNTDKVFQFV